MKQCDWEAMVGKHPNRIAQAPMQQALVLPLRRSPKSEKQPHEARSEETVDKKTKTHRVHGARTCAAGARPAAPSARRPRRHRPGRPHPRPGQLPAVTAVTAAGLSLICNVGTQNS